LLGRSRFKEMALSPESPPTNILSERLSRLLVHEIIEQIPSPDGTKHRAYQLTPKGKALRPLLESMRDWGLKWEPGTEARLEPG
jgi:DNA-binding HxlR family transcriptional regulator